MRPAMRDDPATLDPARVKLLTDAGFTWDQEHGTWFHSRHRRAIAFETVRDRPLSWLQGWIAGATAKPKPPKV
jgi:hypothetical protein